MVQLFSSAQSDHSPQLGLYHPRSWLVFFNASDITLLIVLYDTIEYVTQKPPWGNNKMVLLQRRNYLLGIVEYDSSHAND